MIPRPRPRRKYGFARGWVCDDRLLTWQTVWVWVLFSGAIGCTSMATVTNVRDQPCRQNFARALSEILVEEGEEPERAQKVVDHAATIG
jgi:hypothetical protein